MKTLFISPIGDISDARYMRIPLGILYIAAVLEEEGHTIKVVNVDLFNFSDEEVIEIIKAEKADVVGITTVSCNFKNGAKYAKMIKDLNPNLPVIIGGVHVSNTVKETLDEYPDIDVIVVGEGEITAKELWIELERQKGQSLNKGKLKDIKGLAYKDDNDELIITEPRSFIQDLDSIPFPARHLVSVSGYQKFNVEAHVFASRGCAFNCKFCLLPTSEGSFRKRSAQKVVDEMEYLYRTYGYKLFKFVDNSFSTDLKTVKEICCEIKKRDMPIMWRCQTRLDLLTKELMEYMKGAGCKEILVGVESASERILNKVYGKDLDSGSIYQIFDWGRELGIVITPSFVLGYPDETPEELEATKQLIIDLYKNNYRHPRMCFLTPFPGSELSKNFFGGELSHFLEETDWNRYTHICPTLRTRYMTRHELARIYVEVLAEITDASEERKARMWPEKEKPTRYYPPKVQLYKMKEAIIQKNSRRLNVLGAAR